jgi:NAD(P)H dehydrogenase (quinone)
MARLGRAKQRTKDLTAGTPAIAVSAASGKLGHAVARALADAGLSGHTRLAARNPEKIRLADASAFEIVAGDYEDGRSMAAAFSGMDIALIISSMGSDITRIRQHRIAVDAAIAAGVRRIVYTSSVSALQSGPRQWTTAHLETESYLRQSGIPYTILRVGAYFSNFNYLFFMAEECQRLFFPNVSQPISLTTQADVAAVAVKVLTEAGHERKTYEILAQQTVSMSDIARLMSRLLDKEIIAAPIPVEAFVTELRKQNMRDYEADMLGAFYTAIAAGACTRTSYDMERLIGRQATTAASYLATLFDHPA